MNQITPPAALPQPAVEAANRVRLGRRGFLSTALAAGGGLALGVSVVPSSRALAAGTPAGTVNTWIVINTDNSISMIVPGAEMGQGIISGLPQILSEELPLDWTKLSTTSAPFGAAYSGPFGQVTGGSFTVRLWFQPMLMAGATVRTLLLQAAATQWGLGSAAGLVAQPNNTVLNPATGLSLTYAALAATAAAIPLPLATAPTLLSAGKPYKNIGARVKRPDLPSKVNGTAIFGIDVRVPGMVFAAVKNATVFGATVATVPAAPAGTLAVVNLGDAVAVVATDTGTAMKAAKSLAVTWTVPAGATAISSSAATSAATKLMAATTGVPVAETLGNLTTSMASATKTLTLSYATPYLAHAAMEVVSCTASVTPTSCEIWAATQAPDWVAGTAAAILGLPTSAIKVNVTLSGGGFGRKIEQDYIAHAVKTAKAMGKPVKVTWSREEDFGHDRYRPMAQSKIVAGINANGDIMGWNNRVVTASVSDAHWPGSVANNLDISALDGALGSSGLVYAMAARKVDYQMLRAGIPVGWWRSVGHSYNCFAVESAIDELALAAGKDPLAYRRQLLAGQPRHLAVLNAAAALAGYSTTPPAGTAYGMALSDGFGSIVALVLQVTQITTTTSTTNATTGVVTTTTKVTPKVLNVWAAIDCGLAVNPDSVEAQVQGGVVMGLSSAMWGNMTFSGGSAGSKNFDTYKLARMRDMPVVTTTIINSGAAIGGVGETMVPPMAPALANAFAKLTGTRKRSLPLYSGG